VHEDRITDKTLAPLACKIREIQQLFLSCPNSMATKSKMLQQQARMYTLMLFSFAVEFLLIVSWLFGLINEWCQAWKAHGGFIKVIK
jgi:hypothetical protein